MTDDTQLFDVDVRIDTSAETTVTSFGIRAQDRLAAKNKVTGRLNDAGNSSPFVEFVDAETGEVHVLHSMKIAGVTISEQE